MRHVAERHIVALVSPPSESALLILLSVAGAPRHGYAILKDVESLSDGRVKLSTGTLYGALKRMLEDGWIEAVEEEAASRDRRTYRLTTGGHSVLAMEVERMKRFTHLAGLRLAAEVQAR
jgi:DNA-binding PadR family transcriptional regulator